MRAARKSASGCILLGVMAAVAMFSHAGASEYPNRSIRVVVPFAAAGVTDIVARILFDRIGQAIGQTVVIDDRPSRSDNHWPNRRARRSVLPAGANGTIMRTGRVG